MFNEITICNYLFVVFTANEPSEVGEVIFKLKPKDQDKVTKVKITVTLLNNDVKKDERKPDDVVGNKNLLSKLGVPLPLKALEITVTIVKK